MRSVTDDGCTRTGDEVADPEADATSSMAVMMSVCATSGGGIGVAYANTTYRTLGLLQFQDTAQLADLEGVVVQARIVSGPF